MLLRLQCYNFELHWFPGSDLILADTLSRSVATDTANANTSNVDETCDIEPLNDLRMVASQKAIDEI